MSFRIAYLIGGQGTEGLTGNPLAGRRPRGTLLFREVTALVEHISRPGRPAEPPS
jgi:hypothetical protein